MAQNPLIKRYLDAGMAFTQMTQARAEDIVKDLVTAGEVQAAKTEELVAHLVERSRRNTERLLELVRTEVRDQIAALNLVSEKDLAKLEQRLGLAPRAATASRTKASGTKKKGASAKKATKKKASTKKKAATKKKTGAAKRPAKKAKKKTGAAKRPAKKATKKAT